MFTRTAISIVFATLMACGIAAADAQPVSAGTDPPPSAVESGQAAAKQLQALLDEDLAVVFRRFPLFATVRGVPGYNHLLPDLSPATRERKRADERRMLARLKAIDAGALRGQDRVSLELLLDKMQSAVDGQRFVDSDALVLSTLGGIQTMMPRAAQITPFRTVEDYRDYIRRLSAMPRLADQTIAQLGAGVRTGWMRPAPVVDRVVAAIDAHLTENIDESVLMGPFQRFADGVPESEREALVTAARRAIADDYQPALRRFEVFLKREYLPKAPAEAGLAALPGGAEYYQFLIGAGIVRGMTAAEIHALGLREVERLRNEIGQIRQRTGFAGTTAEFIQILRTDPRFFFTSPEAVLAAYRAMAQRVDPQLERLFHAMPRMPYAVRSMTASEAASSTAANYTGGSLALGTSGFFTINALGYANEATWRVETLFLHEAVPGHHMQIARAAEIDSLHLWRRMVGGNVAYSEGWALYAEKLGFELGLFKDPYQHYGHLQAELFRAARLVVDTGIHAYNWPRARAIEYLATQGGVDDAFAVSEVDRYFSNPTQALGYMLGQRKFLELRARAERALGPRFDVRDFHAAVIDNGPVPLAVLEKLVDEWVAGRGGRARATVMRDSVPDGPAATSLASVVLLQSAPAHATQEVDPVEAQRAHALFDQRWETQMQFYPEWGTFIGDHRYGDRLHDASPESIAADYAAARRTLKEAEAIRRAALSPKDQVSLDIFVYQLQEHLRFEAFKGYRSMSLGALDGFQTDFSELLRVSPVTRRVEVEQLLARMAAFPRRVDQEIVLLREGMALGWVPPRTVLDRVLPQIDGQLTPEVDKSPFFEPFTRLDSGIPPAEQEALRRQARRAIGEQVVPALHRLRRFVVDEYLPAAPTDGALSRYPGGEKVYAAVVQSQTTTDLSAAQIHALGLREMTRLRGEMEAVMREVKFDGDFAQFVKHLNTDPKFFHASPEALLAGYRDIAKRIDPELPRLFAELPRASYGVQAMPSHFSMDRAEFYIPPALDGSRPGWFNANALAFRTRPIWGMETVVAHEAVPGHHLQIARAVEMGELPKFRRGGGFTVYAEGWALYAETLGFELGLYKDPYSRFGHLQWQAFRAARLVVDTGIHALGWTRQQAIDYMAERTGQHLGFVTSEVDRYYSDPGQALAYMIGELKIIELRDRAKQKLGERFDIRRFHMAVLDQGSVPLPVLERSVDAWIAKMAADK